MIFTLEHAREDLGEFVDGGTCDNDKIDAKINEATQILLGRKEIWKNTVRRMRFKLSNNSVSTPHWVETIISYTIDHVAGHSFTPFYEFMEGGPQRTDSLANTCSKDLMEMGGLFPTFYPIDVNDRMQLMAFSTEADDTNLTLTVRGKGQYYNEIFTGGVTPGEAIPIMRWKNGVEGTIDGDSTPSLSTNRFKTIDSIVKPVTKGYISLYAYDTEEADWTSWFLGKYHPDETNPGYKRYKVLNHSTTDGDCMVAVVKLSYTPHKHASDVLLIQSIPALKWTIFSLNAMENNDTNLAKSHLDFALSILAEQKANHDTKSNVINVQMDCHGLGNVPHLA